MTKRIKVLFIVGVFLLSVLSGCAETQSNNTYDIDDIDSINDTVMFDSIIESDDNIPNPASITIKGTEYSTDLESLYLRDMQLTDADIEPLRYMTKLTWLYLNGNQISDVSVLAELTTLKYLILSDNQISDIGPLEGLKQLSILELRHNRIEDARMIEKFAYVNWLYLTGNPIVETVILNDKLVMYNGPGGDIAIPDGVQYILDEAFYGRSDVTGIFIPDSLISVFSARGFPYFVSPLSDCTSLINITVSKDHPTYSSKEGVLFSKDGAELVLFPSGRSGSYAIPGGVKYVRVEPYGIVSPFSCEGLTSISIPDSVEEMSWAPFADCPQLKEINVNSGNRNYSSENGVLFNKEKTIIVAYPPGKTGAYTIPTGVTELGDYAFFNCIGLTSLTIPEGVTSLYYAVGDYIHTAFINCTGLTSVAIPKSVTNIDDGVFDDCPDITIHGYVGSEAHRYAEEKGIPFVAMN